MNNRWLHITFTFLILVFVTSCSSLHFKSHGNIPVLMGHHEEADTLFEIRSHRDFYLWGYYPNNHFVYLDEELASEGAVDAVIVKFGLDDRKYWNSLLYQILTFGMYQPVYYFILAKGRKLDN
jgi:hypothetical protein